jgi:hypothetical protein
VAYFSIQDGVEVKNCSYVAGMLDVSLVCESGACWDNLPGGVMKCHHADESVGTLPVECRSSDDC